MPKVYQPYHMVMVSPWPLLSGVNSLFVMISFLWMFKNYSIGWVYFSLSVLCLVVVLWWRDVVREGTFLGDHGFEVVLGLMFGMLLFIVSEVFFFLSFFWAFFHSSLSVVVDLGMNWPPAGVVSFDPFHVPLLNTIILLSSGVSITWAHQGLLYNSNVNLALFFTWSLGVYFLFLQWFEYSTALFNISDGIFGSVFFMATGFHGFHVIVGTTFLVVVWLRSLGGHLSSFHHFGFEAAAWYWHFVDVVWLFLFVVVYWWGG
uniref:Cytochrome c oxidase subunit 3 n=1 Tax=Mesabolivar sp. ITV1036I2 TaxID=2508675 RepID=A0A411FEQ7_9ARAC|nr:cytochrome c oxidase subunit 3 [Mesabolivar sp. ITV1036I2]